MALGRLGTNALVNIAHSNTLIFRGLLNKVKGGKFAELNARKGKRINVRKTDRLENSTNIQFRKPCWGASKVDLSADLWVLLWSSPTWLLYGFVCLFGRLVVGFLYSIGCYQLNLQYMSGKVIFFSIYKNKNIIRQKIFQCRTKSYLQSSQGQGGLNLKNKVILFLFWTTNRMHTGTKHTHIMLLFPRIKSPSESPECFDLGLVLWQESIEGGKKQTEKWKPKIPRLKD